MLLSLHPDIIVHVENVVSLFSSPSTSSQKVRKCGCHKFLVFYIGLSYFLHKHQMKATKKLTGIYSEHTWVCVMVKLILF